MKRRLPLLLLASLLLFGQLASAALQLCLEEDGNIVVEITLFDCGMVETHAGHQSPGQAPCADDQERAACHGDDAISEYIDLCLDFDFNLNQRQSQSISDCLASNLPQNSAPLAADFQCSYQGATLTRGYEGYDWRGSPTHKWLEHEDLLAILHTAQPVVMRC